MTKKQKDIIIKGIVIPVIISVLLVAISVFILRVAHFPYTSEPSALAGFEYNEITEINDWNGNIEDTVKKADLGDIKSNTIIGSITINDSTYPLIYNADDINALGKMNIVNELIPGQTGTSFMEIYKNESAKLKLINNGSEVTVNTFYNDYEYKVVDVFVAKTDTKLRNAGSGMKSAIVLYTDNSMGTGIGNEKFVAVCELVSGVPVSE